MGGAMDLQAFRRSVEQDEAAPNALSRALQALWWDARGDWARAHELAQAQEDAEGDLVHAYLHRKEGDLGNAGYWYRRAGRARPSTSLSEEWEAIVTELLGRR